MAREGVLSLTLTDLAWRPLPGQDGKIVSAADGEIVLTCIDAFPAHKIDLTADDERAVKAIDPALLPCGVIIEEDGMGEVARGYIMSPQGQINEQGHQIQLTVPNRTTALTWDTTGPGWVAATGIDTIANRLASRSPPWVAHIIDAGAAVPNVVPVHWFQNDPTYSVADLNAFSRADTDAGHAAANQWNVGAISEEYVTAGDCAVSSVAFGSSTYRMFGLSSTFTTYSYTDIDHALYFSTNGTQNPDNGVLQVFERGALVATIGGYFPGDVGTVAVVGGVVKYMLNNIVRHTSALAPTYPCFAACSLFSDGAAIIGATFSNFVAPKDQYYAVGFENATILDAEIQLATRTYRHIRQKWDAQGVPMQELELGLFGAAPTMVLKTADAESPAQLAARNTYTRLIQTCNYSYDTTDLITAGAAFGGGTGDTRVEPENLWRLINDPTYPGYGFYGNVPGTLFPEYNPLFPIDRRVALNGTYYYVVSNKVAVDAMKAKGHWSGELWGGIDDSTLTYVDKSPNAQKEAVERALYVSCVTKLIAHAQVHFTATVTCDGRGRVTQAGDKIALAVVRVNRNGRGAFLETNIAEMPTVTLVTRKYSESEITDTIQMSTLARLLGSDSSSTSDTFRTMQAIRIVPTTSEQVLSVGPTEGAANSLFPFDVPVRLPNTMFRMTAATLKVVLKPARHTVSLNTLGDGAHSHDINIPALTVTDFNLIGHDHTAPIPDHAHGGINGNLGTTGATGIGHGQGTSSPAGLSGGVTAADIGFDHAHHINVTQGGDPVQANINGDHAGLLYMNPGNQGYQATIQASFASGGLLTSFSRDGGGGSNPLGTVTNAHGNTFAATGGGAVANYTGQDGAGVNRSLANGSTGIAFNTTHYGAGVVNFTTGLNPDTGLPSVFTGVTTATKVTTAQTGTTGVGTHTHVLSPDIVETDLGGAYQIWIDQGDGVFIDRSPELGGPWTASTDINIDLSLMTFLQAPGKTIIVRVQPINTGSNPKGLCAVQVSGLWELEKTAVASTIYAA